MVAIADMPDENSDAGLGAFVDCEPILDDLAVGMIEARIDQPRARSLGGSLPAGDVIEEIAALFGGS